MATPQPTKRILVDKGVEALLQDVLSVNTKIEQHRSKLDHHQFALAATMANTAQRVLGQCADVKTKAAKVTKHTAMDLVRAQIEVCNAKSDRACTAAAKRRQTIADTLPPKEREAIRALAGRMRDILMEI